MLLEWIAELLVELEERYGIDLSERRRRYERGS